MTGLWFVLGVFAGVPLGIIVHELGHAISARLLGMKVMEFSLGRAPHPWKFRVSGIQFLFSTQLDRGHVRVTLPSGRAAILRYALMVAAGGAANLAVPLIVFVSAALGPSEFLATVPALVFCVGFGFANVFLVGFAAWQADVATNGVTDERPPSDGQLLSMLRRAPREFFARWRLQSQIAEGMEKTGASVEGRGVCGPFKVLAAFAPAAEYSATFEALLQHPRIQMSERLELIDEYCTWALFRGEQPYLERAVTLSEELYAQRGREATVLGTRGSMLAIAGRTVDATAMLEVVMLTTKSEVDRAISAAVLAWIEHCAGNPLAAARWKELAEKANDGALPIAWMAAEIDRGPLTSAPAQSSSTSV